MSAADELRAFLYHPIAAGLAGFAALAFALLLPLGLGYAVAAYTKLVITPSRAYWTGIVAMVVGVGLFNHVLQRTLVYDWIAEFIAFCAQYDVHVPGGERT